MCTLSHTPSTLVLVSAVIRSMSSAASIPRTFQMPSHAWGMVKRIIRAYGAAHGEESNSVESVAKLAGIHRPMVSGNNNFLRSIGIVELDKPKLTPLGVKLATGIGLENESIITDILQEVIRTTPVLNQSINMLRARGSMELQALRGQIILAVGLNENSHNIAAIKTVIDLLEESKLLEIRDEKVFLLGSLGVQNHGATQTALVEQSSKPPAKDCYVDAKIQKPDGWAEMLLAKFPQFDPAWTDDVKLKWFDAFDRLMKGRGM